MALYAMPLSVAMQELEIVKWENIKMIGKNQPSQIALHVVLYVPMMDAIRTVCESFFLLEFIHVRFRARH